MPDEVAKAGPSPSTDRVDLLEAFAEFVRPNASMPYAKAFQQPLGEWDFKASVVQK